DADHWWTATEIPRSITDAWPQVLDFFGIAAGVGGVEPGSGRLPASAHLAHRASGNLARTAAIRDDQGRVFKHPPWPARRWTGTREPRLPPLTAEVHPAVC